MTRAQAIRRLSQRPCKKRLAKKLMKIAYGCSTYPLWQPTDKLGETVGIWVWPLRVE